MVFVDSLSMSECVHDTLVQVLILIYAIDKAWGKMGVL